MVMLYCGTSEISFLLDRNNHFCSPKYTTLLSGWFFFGVYWLAVDLLEINSQQRLTVTMVDTFIADLKDAIKEAKITPSGQGTMVALYGEHCSFPSSLFSIYSILHCYNAVKGVWIVGTLK